MTHAVEVVPRSRPLLEFAPIHSEVEAALWGKERDEIVDRIIAATRAMAVFVPVHLRDAAYLEAVRALKER